MSQSLVYCKSEQYLEDKDGKPVLENTGSLPYYFNNQFKSPIKINPSSKIELVSADLNLDSLNRISTDEINNSFTQASGRNDTGWLQKVSKIPDGTYTHSTLASKMTQVAAEYSNIDLLNWEIQYQNLSDPNGTFQIQMNTIYDPSKDETDQNQMGVFGSKMGFQEIAGNRDSGVGSLSTAEVSFENKSTLLEPHNLINNNGNIPTPGTAWSNTTNPATLLSNMVIPTDHGMFQGGSVFSAIFQPLKQYTFDPAAFLSGVGSNTFDIYNNVSNLYPDSTFDAYHGSHDYDLIMKDNTGTTRLWLKFINGLTGGTTDKLDYYTLPNSAAQNTFPFGHVVVVNQTDTTIDTTLFNNVDVLLLEQKDLAEITGWSNWKNGFPARFSIIGSDATAQAYIQSHLTLVNVEGAEWGACAVGMNRGEVSMEGTNQVHTGTDGVYSRTGIYNTTPKSGNTFVDNQVQADYVLSVRPAVNGTESYYSMDYGEQATDKVAGEIDWQTMNVQDEVDSTKLKRRMPNITSNDNLMLSVVVFNWGCVKFLMSHDTGGDLNFTEFVEVGNSNRTNPKPPSTSRNIHNIFTESSYPLMPFVCCNGGFASGQQSILVQGNYSPQASATKNLAKLYEKINVNWQLGKTPPEKAYTIPPRQEYPTATEPCDIFTLVDRTMTIEPDGFSGKTANTTYTIPYGKPSVNRPDRTDCVLRLGDFAEDSDYGELLTTNDDWTYEPTRLTKLYKFLGMPKLLLARNTNGSPTEEPNWYSQSDLEGNDSPNFIVNLDNLGRPEGQNSHTSSISQMVGVIPNAELVGNTSERHYNSKYPLPVALNATTEELINNFQVSITRDDGKPAIGLKQPTNLLFRIT